jgi:hypothetical protein
MECEEQARATIQSARVQMSKLIKGTVGSGEDWRNALHYAAYAPKAPRVSLQRLARAAAERGVLSARDHHGRTALGLAPLSLQACCSKSPRTRRCLLTRSTIGSETQRPTHCWSSWLVDRQLIHAMSDLRPDDARRCFLAA